MLMFTSPQIFGAGRVPCGLFVGLFKSKNETNAIVSECITCYHVVAY